MRKPDQTDWAMMKEEKKRVHKPLQISAQIHEIQVQLRRRSLPVGSA